MKYRKMQDKPKKERKTINTTRGEREKERERERERERDREREG